MEQRSKHSTEDISPFDSLPPEVISHIFLFLDYPTLKIARLVSKSWLCASLDPQLLHKEQLFLGVKHFNPKNEEARTFEIQRLQIFNRSTRSFYHMKIEGYDLNWIPREFWGNIGDQIQSLSIVNSILPEERLIKDIRCCPKLRHLTLDSCKNIFSFDDPYPTEGSQSLQTLKIICDPYIESKFRGILLGAPNLISVYLKVRFGSFRGTEVKTLAYLLDYFENNPGVLLDLYLKTSVGCTDTFDVQEELVRLLSLPNVRLKSLHTNFFPRSIYERHQPWVEDLLLWRGDDPVLLSGSVFDSICSNFPNLKKIAFEDSIIAWDAKHFRIPKTITYLYLDVLETGIKEAVLLAGLCSETNTILKEAHFWGHPDLSSSFFIEFSKTHPSLKRFYLADCEINNQNMQAIFQHQVLIQELFIYSNSEITDAGLLGESPEGASCGSGFSIYQLEDLRRLRLESCSGITGMVFEGGRKFRRIKSVSVSRSLTVREEALRCLVENNPSIEVLAIDCIPVGEEFISFVLKTLPSLKEINFHHQAPMFR